MDEFVLRVALLSLNNKGGTLFLKLIWNTTVTDVTSYKIFKNLGGRKNCELRILEQVLKRQ